MIRKWACLSLCSLYIVVAADAAAQLSSDLVPRERLVPRAEQVRLDLERSRRRLGPFRLQPLFLLREISYTDNALGTAEDQISDVTATVAAGTRWILPFGPKAYFRGGLLPEYTWSKEIPERRFVGGAYDISAIALFNRLSLEGSAGLVKRLAVVSPETEARAIGDLRTFGFDAELDVSGRISIFGSAREQEVEFDAEPGDESPVSTVSGLNRDDTAFRAGIRYSLTSFLDFSLAGEHTRSAFQERPLEQNNTSDAVLLGVHYERPRAYLNATIGQRKGKPDDGSTFFPYDETVGSYFASIGEEGPVQVELFGSRSVTYGLSAETPYFIATTNGLAGVVRAGSRIRLRASAEIGTNDYQRGLQIPSDIVDRVDDVLTYGGGMNVRTYRNVSLTLFVSQSEIDSNLDTFDRSVVRVQAGILFSGGF